MNEDTIRPVRDEWLGEQLRELEAPEHRPQFHAELRRRIREERHAARSQRVTRWSLRLAAVAAAAAVVIAALGVPWGDDSPSLSGPQAASAAVVKARVRAAFAALNGLSGTLVATGPSEDAGGRWRFALDAKGDLRLAGPRPGDLETYDAATGVVRSAQHSASLGGGTVFYAERSGVAPGPPDQGPPSWVLPEQYGAFVRAALADSPSWVRETTYEGRPAWRLEVRTTPNAIVPDVSGDHLAITVDRASGMPVRVVESKHGAVLRELRIEDLTVDPELSARTFDPRFPAGAEVTRTDDGFRRTPLGDVAAVVGYRPLIPSWRPPGYRLAGVAVAREAAPTGKEGSNPPSRMVVSLDYQRGIDRFLVTTRLRGHGTWSDPLASPEGYVDSANENPLTGGALAGAEAHLVISTHSSPHLWALTDDLVLTVGGDLSRKELIRIANSLTAR
ncbi:MAG TPA: hypothetical protein VFU64_00330 [Gaiellaceae bacterium]|nr:hypothetical protein [Gaiellaceae bacterium]